MHDMNILSQMIKESARVKLQIEHERLIVYLCEPQDSDSVTVIRNLPSDALVIKVDEFPAPQTIFNGEKGECKRADYVIIGFERKVILYIELKKSNTKTWTHICNQLMGAACFITYCQEIGKYFWKEKSFLDGYQHRFISIVSNSINKTMTRELKRGDIHDTPEKALKITSPHYLQFNRLVGTK
jgi:hypothetical protein